jgi:hypothetical protein
MAASVTYIAVSFVLGRGGKLVPATTQPLADRDRAIRAAAGHGAVKAGAIVLEQRTDTANDTIDEPRLIWHVGTIPDDLLQFA